MSEDRFKRGMADILGELETLFAKDEIGAVQINIALRSGDIRTMRVYAPNFKLLLIAAAAIGQKEALNCPIVEPDADNWEVLK